MVQPAKQLIKFFDQIDQIKQEAEQKKTIIFLDYDGTLTPIVDTPDLAVLADEMRKTVKLLSENYKVSIVSGRATDDVKNKVQIDGIFYAGSHGFEIVHPNGEVTINTEAQIIRKSIDEVYEKLSKKVKGVDGALVEHVKYTISVHYRLVSNDDLPKVEEAVQEILKEYSNLRKTDGKKVFEIRPKIDWDKGKAVNWILEVLNFNAERNQVIYIGDDTTDEDAFKVLENKGYGILVAEQPCETYAEYLIKDTVEVKKVLDSFNEWAKK